MTSSNTGGFLFGTSPAQGPTTVDSSVSGVPQYDQTYQLGLLNMGNQLAAQPYANYPGQTVANLTPDQLEAQQMTEQNVNAAQPDLNQAQNLYSQAGQGFNQNTFNQYMNPYQNDVVQGLTNASNTNFNQNVMPQLNSQFIGSGTYGGSRNAQILSQAAVQNQQNLDSQIANTESTGYQNAMNSYQTGTNQQIASAQGLGSLAGQINNSNLTNESALNAAGQQEQNQNQTSLNSAYNNFQQQQEYPYQQLGFLSGLLSNNQAEIPYSSNTSATTPVNTTNPLTTLGASVGGLGSLNGLT